MWQAVFTGAAHCGAGCALGDFAAEWIVLGLGLVLLSSAMAARAHLELCSRLCGGDRLPIFRHRADAGLEFASGPRGRRQGGHIFADRLRDWHVRLDDLSRPRVARYAADRLVLLAMMQIAMVRGFVTTYPVNWLLIRLG